MRKQLVFDLINLLVAVVVFIVPVYLAYLEFPLEIQLLPSIFLVVPIAITLHKRRLEEEKTERQRIINKAEKLQPLLVKLERIKNIYKIASGLTHNKLFIDYENTFLGWRKYFDRYGDYVKTKFDYYVYDFDWFISQAFRHNKEELFRQFLDFSFIVDGFLYLYDDLWEMIKLAGKSPPKEESKQIQELEENYEDLINALRELRDEDEEIREIFKDDSLLMKQRKKLSNIHSPKH